MGDGVHIGTRFVRHEVHERFRLQPALAFATEILPDSNAPIEERPLITETASGNPLV